MTQQAVVETEPAELTLTEEKPAASPAEGSGEMPSPRDMADEALVAEELLVEEVSIDGMCGVY
jgi:mycofactocin precursor